MLSALSGLISKIDKQVGYHGAKSHLFDKPNVTQGSVTELSLPEIAIPMPIPVKIFFTFQYSFLKALLIG